jgi:enoyl-CoA hydratase
MTVRTEILLREDVDGVATLTLNRPDRRNALSPELIATLRAALAAVDADPAVRAVVLTGAGERCFCAGGDLGGSLGGRAAAGFPGRVADAGAFADLVLDLSRLGKPVVARLNGDALGGGVGLMLACHLVVAPEEARIGLPEVGLGLWPMMVTALLVRHVGRKNAAELMLLGEKLPAAEARGLGLINRVVPRAALDETVGALATTLASRSPATVRFGLEALHHTADLPLEPALYALRDRLVLNTLLEDAAEGVMAFN